MSHPSPSWPQVVLVTGATSGIGRAAAHRLAGEGARLVLAARSPATLAQARQECLDRGAADVLAVPTDVRLRPQVEELFDAARRRFGAVEGVVHAAAVVGYGRFTEVPPEVFDRVVEVDVLGTANVARCALLAFEREGRGSLVVLGSVMGKMAAPLMSSYTCGKWAVAGLVRTLQLETRSRRGIDVSLVSPGSVNTPIYELSGSYTGHPGKPPLPVSSAEAAAGVVVDALRRPRRDADVGPANNLLVWGFRLLPGVFDALVGPLMGQLAQGRAAIPPHPGNIVEPTPERERLAGPWRWWGGRRAGGEGGAS